MATCKYCGSDLEFDNKGKKQKVYCSVACQAKERHDFIFETIERTGVVENAKQARRYMLHKHGTTCSICGQDSWCENPMPVVIDHIDGNPENNLITNLRVVCCNCDALLPTFKARNRGNGRAYRRQRYAEGKSY